MARTHRILLVGYWTGFSVRKASLYSIGFCYIARAASGYIVLQKAKVGDVDDGSNNATGIYERMSLHRDERRPAKRMRAVPQRVHGIIAKDKEGICACY